MSGELQTRKRKDKRKKRGEDGNRQDDIQDTSSNDRGEEDLFSKDDADEKITEEHHDHHHENHGGVFAKLLFVLLFIGLFGALGTIFFQLKGTDLVDTPIKESRYVNILESFVDEHFDDHHDDHGDEHGDEHEDEHEHEEVTEHDEEGSEMEDEHKSVTEEAVINIETGGPEISDHDEKEKIAESSLPEPILDHDDEVTEESIIADVLLSEDAENEEETADIEDSPRLELADDVSNLEVGIDSKEDNVQEESKSLGDVEREQMQEHKASKASYPASSISNDYDYLIREELDDAHKILEEAPDKAQKAFTTILEKYPKSPRAMYGKAMSLDRLSEMLGSNAILEQSIYLYRDVLDLPDVPNDLYKLAGFRCVDRMRFRGFHSKAVRVLQRMQQRLPKMVEILNQMAVTYLIMGQNKNAKEILQQALKLQPTNGFAKAHYGFVLKTEDKLYSEAATFLAEGIASGEPGTLDGRFYFHLGDALTRDGKVADALKVYEEGVRLGLFLSVYQRSLYNVQSLTARPWWSPEQTTYQHYFKLLEKNWELIKSEALPLLDDEDQGFFPENEGLRKKGTWKQFEMFAKGEKITQNCERTPKTCRLIESIPEAAGCRRGQVKLSLLLPGAHVWPHTGPTNCRIRAHLGLVIPNGPRIRVANETRKWKEGEFIIFDDSFEHEVWHEGDSYRLVLIVDFWHPDLTSNQKQTLPAI